MRPTSVVSVVALAALAMAEAIKVRGVFSDPGNFQNCYLREIDMVTGINTTIAALEVCNQVSTTTPASSVGSAQQNVFYLAVATAPAVYAYNFDGQVIGQYPVPPYNQSNALLGLALIPESSSTPGLFMIMQNGLYAVRDDGLKLLMSYTFPGEGQVASAPDGGNNNGGRIFVTDFFSANLFVIDLNTLSVKQLVTSAGRDLDLQYSPLTKQLIELSDYKLYTTDPATGKSIFLLNIPDGPGYPMVNGLSPDGTIFYFFDLAHPWTINFTNNQITQGGPTTLAARAVGYPIWYSW